jgi:hypothetical protein
MTQGFHTNVVIAVSPLCECSYFMTYYQYVIYLLELCLIHWQTEWYTKSKIADPQTTNMKASCTIAMDEIGTENMLQVAAGRRAHSYSLTDWSFVITRNAHSTQISMQSDGKSGKTNMFQRVIVITRG